MRQKRLVIFAIIFSILYYFNFKSPFVVVSQSYTEFHSSTVSTAIGEPTLVLFGYAPKESEVIANGVGVSQTTLADETGYYEFKGIYLPIGEITNEEGKLMYPEICLLARKQGQVTQPTCIPQLPAGYYEYELGPILLSPTARITDRSVLSNQNNQVSGYTTPNTQVELFVSKDIKGVDIRIFSSIFANENNHQTKSDNEGYYAIDLPTEESSDYKIFVASNFKGDNSPKSNTLLYEVLPWYYKIILFLLDIIILLKPYWFPILTILQLILITLIYLKIKHEHKKK